MEQESSNDQTVMLRLLDIIRENEGINDDDLRTQITKDFPIKDMKRIGLLGGLRDQGFLRIQKNQKGQVVYYYQSQEIGKKLEKLDNNDLIIFQLITDCRGRGISKAEIKNKSGMNQQLVNASLKMLDKNGLIKSIKAKDKNRLVFFLFDQDPDDDVAGGPLYENGSLNMDAIESIRNNILTVIDTRGKVSYNEIVKHLGDHWEEARALREDDISNILNTLILDDLLEDWSVLGKPEYIRSKNWNTNNDAGDLMNWLTSIPCSVWPVMNEWKPDGLISPHNWVYFENW